MATAPTTARKITAPPVPIGGDTFAISLKATEAMWVRARARQFGVKPADVIRQLVATARANDPTKGGTVAVIGAKSDADATGRDSGEDGGE